MPFEVVYAPDMFASEEEDKDEEYEQLKELEAEHSVDEDGDLETLRGLFRNIEDKFTCRTTPAYKAGAEAQLAKHADLWAIPDRARGAIYRLFQDRAKSAILKRFREQAQRYEQASQDLQIGKWERDAVILQKCNVIGLTTTGFSKYRPLVASLKPKIVLIEEAAEVLEGPVTAVCVESLEHLILVGDHQQLQGHCNVQELEEVFHLNVSMFERLVRNNMPFKTLTRQRRMDPEIRRALAPIYQDLEDHPSVIGRPPVPGMGEVRSFFFDHDWSEGSDSMLSKYNEPEAEFIVGFFCYLVQAGMVPPHGITVLTFYNGQRKLILKMLRKKVFLAGEYISVNTVDSYQGEENAIVLLSLVRSNENGNIGFLEVANRVCVALSRARLGFYVFGNATQLSKDPLWNQVLAIMGSNPNRVGPRFPVECVNHKKRLEVQYPRDWDGRYGCDKKCLERLDCGHKCPLTCHPFPHELVICRVACRRTLICGHPCIKECCGECDCKSKCAELAKLSENSELVTTIPLSGSYNASGDPGNNSALAVDIGNNHVPMERRGNNRDDHLQTIGYQPITPPLGPVAVRPRTAGPQIGVSSSSSATSDPFGRLSPEKQLQSRVDWGAFASGGVKNDDLMRDEGALQQKQRLLEQNLDLLGLPADQPEDSEVGKPYSSTMKNETQKALKNGRIRHDHDYVLSNGSPGKGMYDGATRTATKSARSGKETMSLIDLD
jgi:helicase required for RNAi-mediated heterochromatin assembly 1